MDHQARDARQSLPDLPQSHAERTTDAPAPTMTPVAAVPVVLIEGSGQLASPFTTPPKPAAAHAVPVSWNPSAPQDFVSRTGPDPPTHGGRGDRSGPVVVLPVPTVSADRIAPNDTPASSPSRAARGPALPPTIRVGSEADVGTPATVPAPRPPGSAAPRRPADTAFCSDTVLAPVTTEFTVVTTSTSAALDLAASPPPCAAAPKRGPSTALAPPPLAGLSLAATLEHYVGNVSALALNTRVSSTSLASSRRAATPARPRLVSGGAGGDDLDDQGEAGLASPPLTRPDVPLLRQDSPATRDAPATLQRTLQSYTSKRAYADRGADRKFGWRQRWRQRVRALKSDPRDRAWAYFDRLIRVIDIYYLISIPTLLAFLCDYSLSYTFQFIALDCLFLVALALQLLRPRFDRYGQLVTDRKEKIRVFLQRPTAWLEIVGAIPVDWVIIFWVLATDSDMSCQKPTFVYGTRFFDQPQPGLTLTGIRYDYQRSNIPPELLWYGILRSIKMMRTAPTFLWAMNAKIPRIPDTISRLLKTLVFSIFLSHVDACCFWVMETTIISEQRWITATRVIVDADRNLTSFTERYLRNFYGSQRALYFIPRDVTELPEIVFQAIEMLIAAVLYGSIFGNLASIVRALDSRAALDKAAKQRNFKKEFLAHYMIEHGFPPALQRKILDHEEFDWQHKKGLDLESLFGDLPPAYRQEVAAHLYYDLVCSVPIFKNTSRAFRLALCERITSIRLPRGFLVCKAGDQANEAYVISSGAVDVLTPDEAQVLVELKAGAFFGEIGLFEKTTRNATIKTTVETTLCVLRKDYFHAVLDNYPEIKDRLGKEIAKRKQQQTQVIAQRRREQQAEQEERERARQQDHLQLNDSREVKASSATSLGSSFLSHLRVKRPSLRNGSGSVSAGALPGIAAAAARSKSTTLMPLS